jgi:RuvB-like protein 1 (pontin 52)
LPSGTNHESPHGIPTDLLDRILIVRTLPYSLQEMVDIISLRAKIEGVNLEDASLSHLGQIASRTSLRCAHIDVLFDWSAVSVALVSLGRLGLSFFCRYAVQLMTPANIIARVNGRTTVTTKDIDEVAQLFYDTKASVKLLEENAGKYPV